jgi:protein-S-isoprenylcysteine O-methyltransferase Ste14
MSAEKMAQPARLNQSGVNRIIQVVGFLVLMGLILFICAGRLDWWAAWVYLGIYLCGIIANSIYTLRHNPDLINERGRMAENTKSWDKVIGILYALFFLATFVIAGLDERFGWSSVPLGLQVLGGIGFGLSMALVFWVMKANAFLSSYVRIQDDRGHYVISTGPYQYVRHPMYAGMILMFWATPMILGSWWALVPAAMTMVLFIIRTSLEDKTLQAELPGYKEYTTRVRYRIVPGVW